MAADRKGYWTYTSSDGFEILVGRTASENDDLTFHVASQDDFWLHVAPTSGSHVVVRNRDHLQRLPRTTLDEAASLAAWYSKSRNAGRIAVHWCLRRNVHKQRGAPAGQVTLDRFEQVKVRPAIPPGVVAVDAPDATAKDPSAKE
jgi:predicted ribosome quality control (RQC) complex YloA/Tae2 family protein